MSSVLQLVVRHLPLADVPEMLIRYYLPGDNSLDDETLKLVFTKIYTMDKKTFLDSGCTVLHSFDDKPAIHDHHNALEYYRNGKIHRDHDKPAYMNSCVKLWYNHGKLHRDVYPAQLFWEGHKKW